jgi:hypothetical protein
LSVANVDCIDSDALVLPPRSRAKDVLLVAMAAIDWSEDPAQTLRVVEDDEKKSSVMRVRRHRSRGAFERARASVWSPRKHDALAADRNAVYTGTAVL